MRSKLLTGLSALVVALFGFVVGCRGAKPAPPPPPTPTVAVVKPVPQSVQTYYEYNGYLDAIEQVQVQARVQGILTAIHFKEGDEVAKDQPLYSIDPREYQAGVATSEASIAKADADIANAKVQIRLAQVEFDRIKGLGTNAAKAEIEKAESNVALYESQLKSANASRGSAMASLSTAKLQLEYTEIKAEIAGRISRTRVTRGNLVGQKEATLLTTIVSLDPLYVYFDLPERDFVEYQQAVAQNQFVRPAMGDLRVDIGVVNEEGYPHSGLIDFRDNRIETGTGTVRLRGRLDNPNVGSQKSRLLYPGLYSRVRVPRGQPIDMVAIPEDAIQSGQEGSFVYVIGPEDKVQKRSVQTGPQLWRTAFTGESKSILPWTLTWPKDVPVPEKPSPPPMLRSVVAVNKSTVPGQGITETDRIVVVGLQKVRPGAPANGELWTMNAPAAPK